MKASQARRFAAALNAHCDAAALNDQAPSLVVGTSIDPVTGAEKQTKAHDASKHDINLVDAVRGLDDEARARLQDAIDACK